ncbi:thioredoxin family protein [Spongiactinospora gelatinilytica]|uniref:Thioredoxin family protein n=1 Tax=Spongiactinospora gelatinilytica TaxID=2666298 RepID=A0A2W2I191_9ACTN|nr:thioredoxin family protein [Spongiactinospora gelatinilytica]PZG56660.1 thioredoxin family protein [Spongiactinospora gelatinilytica]
MVFTYSFMVPLGTPVPDFSLLAVDGRKVGVADLADASALLVVFLSNRCPYVLHIERQFAHFADQYHGRGLATVGICSSDTESHPEDRRQGLAQQALRAEFGFPYLIDGGQEVAKAFRAACTPDFFLYGSDRRLAYRGQFDSARPGNGVPVEGSVLRAAVENVLAGRPVPEPHTPSGGCNIKWRPGNEPA